MFQTSGYDGHAARVIPKYGNLQEFQPLARLIGLVGAILHNVKFRIIGKT